VHVGLHTSKAVEAFVLPSLAFLFAVVQVAYIMITCPYFDYFKFDMFDEGGAQSHLITFVPRAGSFTNVH